MTKNPFEIRVLLPKSDGFHTKNDRNLAEIVGHHIHRLLHGYAVPQGCEARIVLPGASSRPNQSAQDAIRQLETLMTVWEGSDWAYTQPAQEIKKILAGLRQGRPLAETKQES